MELGVLEVDVCPWNRGLVGLCHDLNVGVATTAAAAAGEINLDSFIQDDVNVNVASSSGHVNLDDEDNDTWMH
ncbi:hypothetical protein RIF29_25734 [Crotalaria pallida]|uniref:Uncharacterized protein n=1 Tax=Crotalaria pallida TaxID=3830 RepID=A0AAN9EPD3_CROPI